MMVLFDILIGWRQNELVLMRRAEKDIDWAGRQESDVHGDLLAIGAVRRFLLMTSMGKDSSPSNAPTPCRV
jgi:hypothetical protein